MKEEIPPSLTLRDLCRRAWFDGFFSYSPEGNWAKEANVAFENWWNTKYQPEEIKELERKLERKRKKHEH